MCADETPSGARKRPRTADHAPAMADSALVAMGLRGAVRGGQPCPPALLGSSAATAARAQRLSPASNIAKVRRAPPGVQPLRRMPHV